MGEPLPSLPSFGMNLEPNLETIDLTEQDRFMHDVRAKIVGEQQSRIVDASAHVLKYHGHVGEPGEYTNVALEAESQYQPEPAVRIVCRDTHATTGVAVIQKGRELDGEKKQRYILCNSQRVCD